MRRLNNCWSMRQKTGIAAPLCNASKREVGWPVETSRRRLTRRPRRALESNYATCRQGTGTSCARFATGEEEEGAFLMRMRRSGANKDSGKCSYYTK